MLSGMILVNSGCRASISAKVDCADARGCVDELGCLIPVPAWRQVVHPNVFPTLRAHRDHPLTGDVILSAADSPEGRIDESFQNETEVRR